MCRKKRICLSIIAQTAVICSSILDKVQYKRFKLT